MQISNYVRIILARSFHFIIILDPLKNRSIWIFSLTNNASIYHERSYLTNHIHIHIDRKFYNLHLIIISIYEYHTGENMFILIRRVLDIICSRWRMQMIEINSDDANSMTRKFQDIAMRLANELVNMKFYRVWYELHQLDLILKHVYKDLWENEIVILMKKFIIYLKLHDKNYGRSANSHIKYQYLKTYNFINYVPK